MYNGYVDAVGGLLGKCESLVSKIEYLKISLEDGLGNISDEEQKKQIIDVIDSLTSFQKNYFKIIQAVEKNEKQMNSLLNGIYSILPGDVLKSILGDKINDGNSPENLISEIIDESVKEETSAPVEEASSEKNDATVLPVIEEQGQEETNTPVEEASSEKNDATVLPVIEEQGQEETNTPVEETSSEKADATVLPVIEEQVQEDTSALTEDSTSEKNDATVLPVIEEQVQEDTSASVEKTPSEKNDATVLPVIEEQVQEETSTPVEEASSEKLDEGSSSVDSSSEDPIILLPTVEEKTSTSEINDISSTEENIGANDLVLPVLQQSLGNEKDTTISKLDSTPVNNKILEFVARGSSKALAVTPNQSERLKSSLVTQMGNPEISHILNFPVSQDSRKSILEEMVQDTEKSSGLEVVDETNLEKATEAMKNAYSEGNIPEAERILGLISDYNNKSNQKTLVLSSAA